MPDSQPDGGLHGGFAAVNITPPLGTEMVGYIGLDRRAAGIADELYARAMVLDDGATRLAVVSCDVLGLERETVRAIRQLIVEATGIPPTAVLVSCTHNHTGPLALDLYAPKDLSYVDQLIKKVAGAVRLAKDGLAPVRVGTGFGTEPSVCHNRRLILKDGRAHPPTLVSQLEDVAAIEGPTDPTVGVLAFAADGGPLRGVIVNYACHVDVVTGDRISADYPGVIVEVLQSVYGRELVACFTAGASADVDPIGLGDPRLETRAHYHDPEGSTKARQIGTLLAGEAIKVLAGMDFRATAVLSASSRTLMLPTRRPSEAQIRGARQVLADPSAVPVFEGGKIPPEQLQLRACNLAESVLRYAEFQDQHPTLPVEIQSLRIGDLFLVGIPGELFAALGLQIMAEAAPLRSLVLTCSNDYLGYIPTLTAYEHGGYETMPGWANQLEPEAGPRMVAEAVSLVRSLA